MSNARAQFNNYRGGNSHAKVGGGLGRKQRKCTVTFDRIMRARLMLRTTPMLYCKRAALHHVRTAHPIHGLVTIGPPSSSEKGLGNEATRALAREGVAPRGYPVPRPGTYPCLESREPDRFRMRMGATLEKRSGSVYTTSCMCFAPPFFCARGFPGYAEDTAGHSSSYIALPAHTRSATSRCHTHFIVRTRACAANL